MNDSHQPTHIQCKSTLLGKTYGTNCHAIGAQVVTLMTKYLGVTNRNHVVYNDSMCDKMLCMNMSGCLCDYFSNLDGFWSSFQLGCNYDLFHLFNKLIFHDVFVFFTTLYICLVTHVTKIVTLQLHKVHMLPSSYTYKLFNSTYVPIHIYLLSF